MTQLSFTQLDMHNWTLKIGGPEAPSIRLRARRFLEEALELAQACNVDRENAIRIVNNIYDRPAGDPFQEVGGAAITLLALCEQAQISFVGATEIEWGRINKPEVLAKVQRRQAEKLAEGY